MLILSWFLMMMMNVVCIRKSFITNHLPTLKNVQMRCSQINNQKKSCHLKCLIKTHQFHIKGYLFTSKTFFFFFLWFFKDVLFPFFFFSFFFFPYLNFLLVVLLYHIIWTNYIFTFPYSLTRDKISLMS